MMSPGYDEFPESTVLGEDDTVALHLEEGWITINYKTGERSPLPEAPVKRENRTSPDGKYTLALDTQYVLVKETAGDRILRRESRPERVPTDAIWAPDGQSVIVAWIGDDDQNHLITVHLIGAAFETWRRAPIPAPSRTSKDITDLVRLYAGVTGEFSSGWDSHIDDNLLDFHVALVRQGHESDLVDSMKEEHTKIAARAYEAVFAFKRGDTERAGQSLQQALTLLEATEIEEWANTFVYAPLASAHFLQGDTLAAESALEQALIDIEDESNDFQKRAVYARALLVMGREAEVRKIIEDEDPSGWVSDFHTRLLADLADAAEIDMLKLAFEKWEPESEAKELVIERLLHLGRPELVLQSAWLIEDEHEITVRAWLAWFEKDTTAAEAAYAAVLSEDTYTAARDGDTGALVLLEVDAWRNPKTAEQNYEVLIDDHYACPGYTAALFHGQHRDLAEDAWEDMDEWDRQKTRKIIEKLGKQNLLTTLPADDLEGESEDGSDDASGQAADSKAANSVAGPAGAGAWELVYELFSAGEPSRREVLFYEAIGPALHRGDLDIAHDLFRRLRYTDMNSTSLNSLKDAIIQLSAGAYREFHP